MSVTPYATTRLVDVVYQHTDPDFAAVAANTLAEEYTQQNLDQRLANNSKELAFVNEQLEAATLKVKLGEQSLQQYREVNNAQSLDDRQNIVVARLTSLNQAVTETRTERRSKETLYNQVRGADPTSDTADTFPLIGTNPAVVTAQDQLATLKADRIVARARHYGPDAPKMREIEAQDRRGSQAARRRAAKGDRLRQERVRSGAWRRNATSASDLERAKGASMRSRSKERRLPHPAAQARQRAAVYPVAARSSRRSCRSSPTAAPTTSR